jgi:hypothetical protein
MSIITKINQSVKNFIKIRNKNLENITWVEMPTNVSIKNGRMIFTTKK